MSETQGQIEYCLASIHWEYEDQLPKDLTKREYDDMFRLSAVICGVRMFQYIQLRNKRIFLMQK